MAAEGFSIVLAFLVKWKLLEAFVIPTGAMAPALYGAHADVACQNCGMEYAVSMSRWAQTWQPRESVRAACPNCGKLSDIGLRHPIETGDRILVEKVSQPRRWDLMVFKHPEDRRTNHIMRVAGLPGETLEIADGDIFVDGHRLQKEPFSARDMWLFVHDSSRAVKRGLPGSSRWEPEQSASCWKLRDGEWAFHGLNATCDALVFSGRLTDEIAYNGRESLPGSFADQPPLVGDIKLACDLKQFSGQGNLEICWEFRHQKAKAAISADGHVEIVTLAVPKPAVEGIAREKTVRGRLQGVFADARQVVFAVRDGQAYVTQGNRLVASAEVGPGDLASANLRMKEAAEPCCLKIRGSRCQVTLSRIVLWKDLYYRNLDQIPGTERETGWGCAGHPVRLAKNQYFVLGDNSLRGRDSRFWGTVPADAVTGIARWAYWPPSRWRRFQ